MSKSITIRMADRFGMEPTPFEATLRATVMPSRDVGREQLAAFLLVAEQYNLNPLTKEIYAFPSKGGGITPIVGVDGWYKLMNAHPKFDGIEFNDDLDEAGALVSVEARIYRKDRSHPVSVREYMVECKRNTDPWKQWPRRMLRHKAAIQAARIAFGFAGIYDPDEGERIVVDAEVVPDSVTQRIDSLPEKQEAEGGPAEKKAPPKKKNARKSAKKKPAAKKPEPEPEPEEEPAEDDGATDDDDVEGI